MLKIVTWNCARGKPTIKLPRLLSANPDVLVVQECARPAELPAPAPPRPGPSGAGLLQLAGPTQVWHGDNRNQGLLVQVNDGLHLRPSKEQPTPAKFFLPVQVRGRADFNLLAVWAKPAAQRPLYVTTLFQGVEAYRDFIRSAPTILIGDLNTVRLPSANDPHMAFVNLLRDEFDLVSAYHEFHGLEHGQEEQDTFFDRTKKNKPYHIDYCFIPRSWLPRLANVAVGSFDDWHDLSDHVPVLVDLEM